VTRYSAAFYLPVTATLHCATVCTTAPYLQTRASIPRPVLPGLGDQAWVGNALREGFALSRVVRSMASAPLPRPGDPVGSALVQVWC
jgi:hypothetical protein